MDKEFLHQQIDRYFEAQLTQQEEKVLFKTLLQMEGQDLVADEALAVMLASRMPIKAARSGKGPHIMRFAGIAVSIAVVFCIGILMTNKPKETETFAYVYGKKIHDPHEIKNLVATQLQDIGESTELFSQTLSSDLDDIREALTSDEI